MTFGQESNTRWLWFITYFFLPLNVIGQAVALFIFLDQIEIGGFYLLFILVQLCLVLATILGLHQRKSWGWYCIFVLFGLQLIGTPIKVHAKALMHYEVIHALGRNAERPSIFDAGPMVSFFLLMLVWTIPNSIYMYRRRSLFGISDSVGYSPTNLSDANEDNTADFQHMQTNARYVVTDDEEQSFAEAGKEFDGGNIREGLWAKVCVEESDEDKRRNKYLEYRAYQILDAKIRHGEQLIKQEHEKALKDKKLKNERIKKLNNFVVIRFLVWLLALVAFTIYFISTARHHNESYIATYVFAVIFYTLLYVVHVRGSLTKRFGTQGQSSAKQ